VARHAALTPAPPPRPWTPPQAEQYRGPEDPSQAPMAFLLRTSGAGSALDAAAPLLPTGNVVGGLPAELLTAAELQGLAGGLVMGVDMVAAMPGLPLPAVAAAAAAVAAAWGHAGEAAALADPGALHRAQGALEGVPGGLSSLYA